MSGSDVECMRDHSHARVLYWLSHDLSFECKDKQYNDEERTVILECVKVLKQKEEQLKDKHPYKQWCSIGDYTLFR